MRSAQTTPELVPTHTVRGTIIHVNSQDKSFIQKVEDVLETWAVQPVNRFVDVVTTATSSPNPKWFRSVPWNSANAPVQNLPAPKEGDFVVLGFMGGNGDIPYVLSHMPGDATIAAHANAAASRPAAPTATQTAAFGQMQSSQDALVSLGYLPAPELGL